MAEDEREPREPLYALRQRWAAADAEVALVAAELREALRDRQRLTVLERRFCAAVDAFQVEQGKLRAALFFTKDVSADV